MGKRAIRVITPFVDLATRHSVKLLDLPQKGGSIDPHRIIHTIQYPEYPEGKIMKKNWFQNCWTIWESNPGPPLNLSPTMTGFC